jgi:hypothetical protein
MAVDLKHEMKNGYLYVEAIGILEDLPEWKNNVDNYYKLATKYEADVILLDEVELISPYDVLMQQEIVKYIAKTFPFEVRYLKVAVVKQKSFENVGKFWESSSAKEGFNGFRFYTDMDEAIEWITRA